MEPGVGTEGASWLHDNLFSSSQRLLLRRNTDRPTLSCCSSGAHKWPFKELVTCRDYFVECELKTPYEVMTVELVNVLEIIHVIYLNFISLSHFEVILYLK